MPFGSSVDFGSSKTAIDAGRTRIPLHGGREEWMTDSDGARCQVIIYGYEESLSTRC